MVSPLTPSLNVSPHYTKDRISNNKSRYQAQVHSVVMYFLVLEQRCLENAASKKNIYICCQDLTHL